MTVGSPATSSTRWPCGRTRTATLGSIRRISSIASHEIESLSVEHYKYAARATLTGGRTMQMRDVWFPLRSIHQAAR